MSNKQIMKLADMLGVIEAILFAVLLILSIWQTNAIIIKCLATDVILLFATGLTYYVAEYKEKNKNN